MENNNYAPVTVVIPCFRCAATIGRAIESIIEQTQLPREVILVDDASDDNTLELLKVFEQKYPEWITVIELKENNGAASARNAGWTFATQPYIALLDADDSWHPGKIACQYEFMRTHPEVALCGHNYCLSNQSDEQETQLLPLAFETIGMYQLLFSNPFVTPSVMVKSGIPFRFMQGQRYIDDHLLWMEIVLAGLTVVKLSAPLTKIYKGLYGEAGLSSHLWSMEKSELYNYWYLYKTRRMSLLLMLFFEFFSLAKYLRRLLIIGSKKVCALF
jgi:glycosyltransferase involved in cell wall biosynthesis